MKKLETVHMLAEALAKREWTPLRTRRSTVLTQVQMAWRRSYACPLPKFQ